MDANYLKQTIGQTLSSAIVSLLSHGYPSQSQTTDPITYIAHYLLHHSASQIQISQDAQTRKSLNLLLQSVQQTTRTESENRRRFELELKGRTSVIAEKETARESVVAKGGNGADGAETGGTGAEEEKRSQQPDVIAEGDEGKEEADAAAGGGEKAAEGDDDKPGEFAGGTTTGGGGGGPDDTTIAESTIEEEKEEDV